MTTAVSPLVNTEVKFRLDPTFVATYRDKTPPFGFNGLGELVFRRTYSRIKPDGTNEDWTDTVERVVNGTYSMQKRWITSQCLRWRDTKAQRSAQEMFDRMWNMKFLPPGRGLWSMGSPMTEERGIEACLFNCGFTTTAPYLEDLTAPFAWLMDGSMLGIGIGFDTLGAGRIKLYEPNTTTETFVIPDTREGWVESVRQLLTSFFYVDKDAVVFDYSIIRQPGKPIKGFGGLASGPKPLMQLHERIRAQLVGRGGETIMSRDIVDIMNHIGACVVAGNLRRSAELAIGDPSDKTFLDLKNYEENPDRAAYGWVSNNSVRATLGMDYSRIAERIRLNGEPGVLWFENVHKYGRLGEINVPDDSDAIGCNPCVTADTWVHTSEGPRQVLDLIGTPFTAVVAGKEYNASGFWKTGTKKVLRLTTDRGYELRLTDNHKVLVEVARRDRPGGGYNVDQEWVESGDLRPGDRVVIHNHRDYAWVGSGTFEQGWLLGSVVGDGGHNPESYMTYTRFWGPSQDLMAEQAATYIRTLEGTLRSDFSGGTSNTANDCTTVSTRTLTTLAEQYLTPSKEVLPALENTGSDFHRGFLRGFFDADGSVQGGVEKGCSVRLSQSHLTRLKTAQRMLLRLGIASIIYENRRLAGVRLLPNGLGELAEYNVKAQHELVISKDNIREFRDRVGFFKPEKKEALDSLVSSVMRGPYKERFTTKVSSVEEDGIEDVYDVTVEEVHAFDANGIYAHNCGEIALHSNGGGGELCNIAETFPARHDSLEDFQRTLKFAYLYTKTVTLSKTPWPETNEVMLKNRRVGVSQSGVVQAIDKFGVGEYRKWCEEGYQSLQYYDKVYSNWLKIPRSIRLSTQKPSGTVSLLAGATPGLHFPESRTYLRRMRLAKASDLVTPLIAAGYHVEPAVGQEDSTVVVEVPVRIEEDIRTADEVSMWEQLSLTAFMQKHWCDNLTSSTITFDPDTEGHQIEAALNMYQYQLKGISFLPRTEAGAYPQMPYEAISDEEYERRVAKLKTLDFDGMREEAKGERFCDSDVCMIEV